MTANEARSKALWNQLFKLKPDVCHAINNAVNNGEFSIYYNNDDLPLEIINILNNLNYNVSLALNGIELNFKDL